MADEAAQSQACSSSFLGFLGSLALVGGVLLSGELLGVGGGGVGLVDVSALLSGSERSAFHDALHPGRHLS